MLAINDIYTALTITLATVLFAFGLLYYSLRRNAETPVYRTALQLMTFTYCFFGLINVLDLWNRIYLPDNTADVLMFQTATLVVAVSQTFLFTNTLVLLIRPAYITRKKVLRELVPIVTLSALLVAACFILSDVWVTISVYLFILFYIGLLIKYTRLFIITYRDCLRKMDNFFSEPEAEHLRWVKVSFYAALSIGLLALSASLFPNARFGVVCEAVYLLFYLYFAIRFINYGFIFKKMETALSDDAPLSEQPQEDTNTLPTAKIETGLKIWIDEKRFLQPGITIGDVSAYIGTNRKYLSLYINQNMNLTFREWINRLRIEEAKRLLLDFPDMNVSEIALQTGFATQSHFSQQFRAVTNLSPSNWRLQGKN